jgi:ATP phosphoribosyltransferase regulatory subunit HisZ
MDVIRPSFLERSQRLATGEANVERVPESDFSLVQLPAEMDRLTLASAREVDQAKTHVLELATKLVDAADVVVYRLAGRLLAVEGLFSHVVAVATHFPA